MLGARAWCGVDRGCRDVSGICLVAVDKAMAMNVSSNLWAVRSVFMTWLRLVGVLVSINLKLHLGSSLPGHGAS